MKVTVLGCGGSMGVPHANGDWGRCDPNEPRNRRRRPSILVEHAGTSVLVDTGPDLREQLISASVKRLDAVLWTHAHADHVHGVDDLRVLNRAMGGEIPVHANRETLDQIGQSFPYLFERRPGASPYYRPYLTPVEITGSFAIGRLAIRPFVQDHGFGTSMGFRFGPFAYSTDVVTLDEAAFEALAGVEVWIVDSLREAPHPTHAHLARTLEWIERVGPRRAYLTHMGYESDYATIASKLPAHVAPAHDGLVIELADTVDESRGSPHTVLE